MCIFFSQVDVEVELECGRGARGLQNVTGGGRPVQSLEGRVQPAVVSQVRLGDQRRDLLQSAPTSASLSSRTALCGPGVAAEPAAVRLTV